MAREGSKSTSINEKTYKGLKQIANDTHRSIPQTIAFLVDFYNQMQLQKEAS